MMEQRAKSVDTALLLEEYRTLLQTVDTLPLRITGNSMAPFLVHLRDTVYLSRVDRPLKRGDIVLYQRKNGTYILHRIYAREGAAFAMVGDAQTYIEHGISEEQIFAWVCYAVRKGKKQAPGSFWWEFFEKIWIRMVGLRPWLMRLYSVCARRSGRKK